MEGWFKLTKLAKKYERKATMIVVLTHSKDIARNKKYVEKMGDKIDYSVAHDPKTGKTSDYAYDGFILADRWVKSTTTPNSSRGYPTVFYIDKDGRIAYINSGQNIEKHVDELIKGSFNPEMARQKDIESYMLKGVYDNYKENHFSAALKAVNKSIELMPDNIHVKEWKFKVLLATDEEGAYDYAWEVLDTYPWEKNNNVWTLSKSWASLIIDSSPTTKHKLTKPDYDLAIAMGLKIAVLEYDNRLKAMGYQTAARAYFMKGNLKLGREMMLNAIAVNDQSDDSYFKTKLRNFERKFGKKKD